MHRSRPTPQRIRWDDMPWSHPTAAGLDLGARWETGWSSTASLR